MALDKLEIKNWLKRIGKDRYWLAQQCKVSKKTVDRWLSSNQTISPKILAFIETLIGNTGEESLRRDIRYDEIFTFTVRLTQEEWDELLKGVPIGSQREAEEYVRSLLQSVVDDCPVDIMSSQYDVSKSILSTVTSEFSNPQEQPSPSQKSEESVFSDDDPFAKFFKNSKEP